MRTELIDVWINCPDAACARVIGEACVDARIAACANILAPIESVFRWQGKLEQARETPLLLKTRADLFDRVCAQVRELHPYDVPAITAMDLPHADAGFAEWVIAETAEV